MLPIRDINRSLTTPHINRILLISNIIIFVVYWLAAEGFLLGERFAATIEQEFVMIPSEVIHLQRLYTVLTSMFMHGGWFHLFGNMLFLYIFGDNIEDAFGHVGYLVFYLICGVAAAAGHVLTILYAPFINQMLGLAISSDLTTGVIGASGAISGVLGAYVVLYPKARILTLISYVILPIPAFIFLGFWFIMQWLYALFDVAGGVAYGAHIAGFIAGAILALLFARKRKKAREARFDF